MSWLHEHLDSRATAGAPVVFAPSDDPVLMHFAGLVEPDMTSLDADLGGHPMVLYYDSPITKITVTAQYRGQQAPETLAWQWQPGNPTSDRRTGLTTPAPDSPLTPVTRRVCSLLVSTPFVHLSAERSDTGLVVHGARQAGADTYDFLELQRSD